MTDYHSAVTSESPGDESISIPTTTTSHTTTTATKRTSLTNKQLEEKAAAAALSSSPSTIPSSSKSIFDENGKLSSASAATSLKYAKARDLPSFPSSGLPMSSAGAAASLAASNQKPFEHWKAGQIPAANKAALLAKDYEAKPLWQPEASTAGSRAAILAHRDTLVKTAEKKAKEDEDAALQKMAQSRVDKSREVNPEIQQRALQAASASVTRSRAGSTPAKPEPVVSNADPSWALKAATKSHKDGVPGGAFAPGDPGFEAARIQNMAKQNVNKQLYGSSPPVSVETQEKQRQDKLRASAVAMAQKMYAIQQQQLDEAAASASAPRSDSMTAARGVRSSRLSASSGSAVEDPVYSGNLEEAARKLAQERLAKIHDEHAEYRQYYGQSSPPQRSRLSMRLRNRGGSNTLDDDSDEEGARRVRSQMTIFQSRVADVDNKKRQADRDALLQMAHRNVDAQMRSMDDRVFQETGKASPAQMEAWEKAAREKAQRDSDERMQHTGKVHIGGGKYLDQSEVDAIARARLQPTLDDISRKAEEQRARDEEERALKEQQMRDKEKKKLDEANEKARLRAEKDATRRSAEISGERSRFSLFNRKAATPAVVATETVTEDVAAPRTSVTTETTYDPSHAVSVKDGNTVHDIVTSSTTNLVQPVTSLVPEEPIEPTHVETRPSVELENLPPHSSMDPHTIRRSIDDDSDTAAVGAAGLDSSSQPSTSKVKSWMKGRFRGKSNAAGSGEMPAVPESGEYTPATTSTALGSAAAGKPASDTTRSDSIRDVAMAGRTGTTETDDLYGSSSGRAGSPTRALPTSHHVAAPTSTTTATAAQVNRSPSISSLSSSDAGGVVDSQDKTQSSRSAPLAAGATTTRTSTDAPVRSSIDQSTDDENRGRRGFRQRLLGKVKRDNKTLVQPDAKNAAPETAGATSSASTAAVKQDLSKSGYVTQKPANTASSAAPTSASGTHTSNAGGHTHGSSGPGTTSTYSAVTSPHTGAVSTSEDEGEFEEARDTFEDAPTGERTAVLPAVPEGKNVGHERSKFHEEL